MEIKNKDAYVLYANNGMLNKPGFHSTASYSYNIECGVGNELQIKSWIDHDAYFNIAGCNNDHVNLSFEFDSKEEFENSIYKIRKLKNALIEFEIEFTAAKLLYEDLKARQLLMEEKDGSINKGSK